ncbi:MAG: calcium/sodium antiporter [Hydrogenophaga sp.]|uniref:calcium/sodium antiporter n=1 Tax=Hydrogenophaga sp. TaxID=1904254 RepID=UPI001D7BDFBF|nr:calcium/sodium antiporter [Hydrogenophaga sp.]MBX3608803.1 calcium/sodium antiporter [Hydrogenophaga sp.]
MTNLLIFAAGIAGLIAGAELLVRGASKLALSFGLSPLVVGLTIVAFGTSAPELAVSVGAVASGQTDIAIGNVVGSNVLNVLLILGVSAVITPLAVNVQLIRQEAPIMIGAAVLLLVFAIDGTVRWYEAAVLCAGMVAYTVFLIVQSRRAGSGAGGSYDTGVAPAKTGAWDARWWVQLLLIAAGMALLVGGAQALVHAAVAFAQMLGQSDVVIGLTVVALGTSMPEIATSLMAAFKGERDMAVGNVVGSNTFNILGCIGISGLVAGSQGLQVPAPVLHFDLWVMVAVSLACLPVFISGREIARWEGAVFVGYYLAYTTYLVLAAQHHAAALSAFSTVMLSFVVPLTVVTMVVVMVRGSGKR